MNKGGDLQIWWIPQVPMKAFIAPVSSVEEGVKLLNVLADYDIFQYENNVKGDYCNAGGLQVFEAESNEFIDWFDEETGIDCPIEWLEQKAA